MSVRVASRLWHSLKPGVYRTWTSPQHPSLSKTQRLLEVLRYAYVDTGAIILYDVYTPKTAECGFSSGDTLKFYFLT